jgi:hypothetical protein
VSSWFSSFAISVKFFLFFQGTILLTLKDGEKPLNNKDLYEYFSQFGEVKVVRDYKNHPKYVYGNIASFSSEL